jgi:hypothetical protein
MLADYNLCPSEAVAGKPMPVFTQIRRGLIARFGRFFRKLYIQMCMYMYVSMCSNRSEEASQRALADFAVSYIYKCVCTCM